MRGTSFAALAFLAAACGGSPDPDGEEETIRRPAVEIVSGGGRTSGGGMGLEVQLGGGIPQTRATGAGLVIEGNAAVKP